MRARDDLKSSVPLALSYAAPAGLAAARHGRRPRGDVRAVPWSRRSDRPTGDAAAT